MSTELALWLTLFVWLAILAMPITYKLWEKYTYWVMKNFGDVKNASNPCPKCGSLDLTYNSDFCYGCYYDTLTEISKEKQVKNG